jgi:hypothetical protein
LEQWLNNQIINPLIFFTWFKSYLNLSSIGDVSTHSVIHEPNSAIKNNLPTLPKKNTTRKRNRHDADAARSAAGSHNTPHCPTMMQM